MFYSSTRGQTSFDEMELVANAQGNATSERESVRFNGIMRKVEVSQWRNGCCRACDAQSCSLCDLEGT